MNTFINKISKISRSIKSPLGLQRQHNSFNNVFLNRQSDANNQLNCRFYSTDDSNPKNGSGSSNTASRGNDVNSSSPPIPTFIKNNQFLSKPRSNKSVILYANNLIYKGRELIDRGQFTKAEKNILSGFRSIQSKINPMSSLFAIPNHAVGLISYQLGKYSIGEQFLKYSLDRSEIDDKKSSLYFIRNHVEASNDLGLTLLRQCRYQEALEAFNKALEIAKKFEISSLLPSIYTNFGEYYKELGYYENALKYHGIAHSQMIYNEEVDGVNMYRIYLNRAQVLRMNGNIEDGKGFLFRGLKLLLNRLQKMGYASTKIPKHNDWAKCLIEFGHFYFKEGHIAKALYKFQSARDIFEEMGNINTPDSIFNLLNIALIQKHYNVNSLDPIQLQESINQILSKIEKPLESLKQERQEKFISKFKIDNVIQSLKESKLINSNNNNNNSCSVNSNKKMKPVNLIDPNHFQLSGI